MSPESRRREEKRRRQEILGAIEWAGYGVMVVYAASVFAHWVRGL